MQCEHCISTVYLALGVPKENMLGAAKLYGCYNTGLFFVAVVALMCSFIFENTYTVCSSTYCTYACSIHRYSIKPQCRYISEVLKSRYLQEGCNAKLSNARFSKLYWIHVDSRRVHRLVVEMFSVSTRINFL